MRDPPLRVLQVASGDGWGGAEAQILGLARELERSPDVALRIALFNRGLLEEQLRREGLDVLVLDEKAMSPPRILRELQLQLPNFRPQIVHTHGYKANVLGSLAAALVPGARSLRTVHGAPEYSIEPWQLHKRAYRFLDWFTGRYVQRPLVAVTGPLSHLLARQYPRRRIAVIENGLDLERVHRASSEPVEIPGPRDAVKVAFVGRFVPLKRIDLVIDTAVLLHRESGTRFSFYLFGDGPLASEVKQRVRERGLEDQCFLMGFKANIYPYLRRMNALLMPSDHEGLPMTLLEALALGVPVVAHAVGGIPELLEAGRLGALVGKQEASEYARTIAECFVGGAEDAAHRAREGQQAVGERYSAARTAEAYRRLYADLAGRSA